MSQVVAPQYFCTECHKEINIIENYCFNNLCCDCYEKHINIISNILNKKLHKKEKDSNEK